MGKRGGELSEHIRWSALEVFLEMGFERTSMDAVASRAKSSKRTLYAHFESKENLYLAVVDMVRGLALKRLGLPGDYGEDASDALTLFCARYLHLLGYEPAIQMCRVSIAEAARFPQGAARHFEAIFAEVDSRLSNYLKKMYDLTDHIAVEASQKLLGGLLYPKLIRALYGLDQLEKSFDSEIPMSEPDLLRIRRAVNDTINSLS